MNRKATDAIPELLDFVQESVVVYGLDGRVTIWNRASERLYGWSEADAIGQPLQEFLRTSRETTAERNARLREDGLWEGTVFRRTREGMRIAVKIKTVLRRDIQGEPLDILEMGVDVTTQQNAEEALARAEHRYYNVFQAMAVSFWELDFTPVGAMVQKLMRGGVTDLARYFADHPAFVRKMIRATRVLDVNDQSVELLGRGDKQEMLSSLEPYWPEASQHVYAASVVAAVQGKPHYATETRLSSIDGREYDVWFTACFPPEMVARGKLLIGIIDISEDKRAKRELGNSEQRYRSLFHFLPVALIQLDRGELAGVFARMHTDGVRDLQQFFDANPGFYEYATNSIRIVEVNRRTVELFGAQDETQLLGPVARVWSEAPDVIRRSMAARFGGASRFESEMKIRTFDGRIREVLYVAYFPEAFNQNALGLSCLVDISDRVKAESMLAEIQAEFAHAARVSMLGELTASIAHEVNQPLGAILTNGEAALRWLNRPEPDLAELRALSTRTIADARRAADIIGRIRGMATRTEPERTPLALNSVIEEVLLFLRPELARQNVKTLLDLARDIPDVMADRVQLQQVVSNLAVNAIHAMAHRDERRLSIRTMQLDDRTLCTEIEDTGHGIQTDHLERLFRSFFSTKDGGMGIGLSICRSIIEAHGGRIEAANLPGGRGALFRFMLPTLADHTHV